MYECPNCAANIKFDIKRQQLYCEYCETVISPYSVEKERDAEESQYFDTMVYSCPQCGGSILSEDTTAATFCSYCGASTILTGRMSKCKKPKYIIPFQKTKEDCREEYRKMVRGAFFAPKEFKDAEALKQFRAIYMPYWVCTVEGKEQITFEGVSTGQRGNYRITHYTDFTTNAVSKYEGFTFDASEAFPDQLSAQIEPYDLKEKKAFTESFLSGFYADINDVEGSDYGEIARNMAIQHGSEEFRKQYPNYKFGKSEDGITLKDAMEFQEAKEELAMFPVWFLAYRKKDRVAYGVMNGQTGKVAVDLPIDIKKFVALSLLLAIPIIAFLNLFLVMKPNILLGCLVILASMLCILIHERTAQALQKQFYEDFQVQVEDKEEQREEKRKLKNTLNTVFGVSLYIFNILFLLWANGSDLFSWLKPSVVLALTEGIFLTVLAVRIRKNYRIEDVFIYNEEAYKEQWKKKLLYFIKPSVAILLAIIVLVINPVDDVIYYGAFILGMGMMLWSMLDLLVIQNEMIMRPLPHFSRRGGDEFEQKFK